MQIYSGHSFATCQIISCQRFHLHWNSVIWTFLRCPRVSFEHCCPWGIFQFQHYSSNLHCSGGCCGAMPLLHGVFNAEWLFGKNAPEQKKCFQMFLIPVPFTSQKNLMWLLKLLLPNTVIYNTVSTTLRFTFSTVDHLIVSVRRVEH